MHLQPQSSSPLQRYWALLLVLCLVQFSGIWIYPPSSTALFDNISGEKYLGLPFQWSVWALVALSFLLHVIQRGFAPLMSAVGIFVPFWIMGLVAGVFGYDPIGSTRLVILWTLAIIASGMLGLELPAERAGRLICICLTLFMLLSVLLALAMPSVGTQLYGFTSVWRGGFASKNTLGWAAALSLVASLALCQRQAWRWQAAAAVLALACLIGSGSKGGLVATLVTLAYVFLLRRIAGRVTTGFGIFIMLSLALAAAVSALLVAPLILEALGRDVTLTGRTDVWSSYFASMIKTPWLGDGPGAYTGLSPLTLPLANKLSYLGTIVTPHNVYLAVLGDTGLFGLLAYLSAMLYLTLVRPLSRPGRYTLLSAAVGFLILAHGLVETHEVFIPGLAWLLLVFGYAVDQQQPEQTGTPLAEAGRRHTTSLATVNARKSS